MLSSRSRLAALGAAVLLSTAACGGDNPDPLSGTKVPAVPAVPSETPSPAPTLSTVPAEAAVKTDAGAVAFVTYYFETVLNEAYTLGKVDKLVELSDPNCVVCRATVGDIAYFTLARQAAQGGEVSVSGVKVETAGEALTAVRVTLAAEKLSYKNLDGTTAYSVPARNNQGLFIQVQWSEAEKSWRVRQIVDQSVVEPKT